MEQEHLLHLYMGDGKGKTTAAMGLALRAIGQKRTVFITQFMKDGMSAEVSVLSKFENVAVGSITPMEKFLFQMNDEEKNQIKTLWAKDLQQLNEIICKNKPQMIIFDELALAVYCEMIDEKDLFSLVDSSLKYGEVVLTGGKAPNSLIERANYVSEIKKIKHPYDCGIIAREGIEY